MKRDWRSFFRTPPGRRFTEYYRRSQQQRSMAKRIARVGLGIGLTLVGVMLWFLPGPGWLFVIFGMTTVASESCVLARYLDQTELFMRGILRRLRGWWRAMSPTQ